MGVGGLDRQPAAVRHGVARIDREVEDRVFELAGIGMGAPQPAGQHGLDADRLAERAAQQLGHAGDQLLASSGSGASGCWREKASRRWVKRAARVRALHGAARCSGSTSVVAARQPALQQVERADDHGQHVVEVVRDAAGELADRLHLLRLPQLLFGFDAAGRFHGFRHDGDDDVLLVLYRTQRKVERALARRKIDGERR